MVEMKTDSKSRDDIIVRRVCKSDLKEVMNIYQNATLEAYVDGIFKAFVKHSNLPMMSNLGMSSHIGMYFACLILPIVISYGFIVFMPCGDVKTADTFFAQEKHAMFVAETNGRIVGTAGIRVPNYTKGGPYKGLRREGDAELVRMNVSPSFQGRGISRLLLDAAVNFARQQGFHRLVLTSTTLQHVASSVVYPKYGFVKVKDFHILLGIRSMFMCKEL